MNDGRTASELEEPPRDVTDVTRRNVAAMRRLEEAAMANCSRSDRFASFVSRICGTMGFVLFHAAWFGGWIVFNTLPGLPHFDPYPFEFLLLVVSLEAIFLSTFILISQNYELRISERRNQLDLQINLLSEQENTKMLQMLEAIAHKVGAGVEDDPQVRALEQATRPEALVEQIEEAYAQSASTTRAAAGGPPDC